MSWNLGVMGGTFDPIHYGHLVNASEAAYRLELDEIVFMPTGQPWHKDTWHVSAAEQRYEMTRLAVAANPRFSASRMEIDRAGPTYTVDTLRELRAMHGRRTRLYFIAGVDVLPSFGTWRESGSLLDLAHLVFCTRSGYEPDWTALTAWHRATLLDVPAWEISSTLIRHRVRQGQPIHYLVPEPVETYITRSGLYRAEAC